MVAEFTLGRIGLDIDVDEIESVSGSAQYNRGEVTLRGVFKAATLEETLAQRDELIAQAETVEWLPLTWTQDPRMDGFYRLGSSDIDVASLTDGGFIPFSAKLDRIGPGGSVGLQSRLADGLRPNSHGITTSTATPSFGIPGGIIRLDYDPTILVGAAPAVRRTWQGATPGTAAALTPFTGIQSPHNQPELFSNPYTVGATYLANPVVYVHPSRFYYYAAEVYTGGLLRAGKWVGEHPTADTADGLEWVLSNGIVRVSGTVHKTGEVASFQTRLAVGSPASAWSTNPTTWTVADRLAGSWVSSAKWTGLEILENRPERATIRLTSNYWVTERPLICDITVWRGRPVIGISMYAISLGSIVAAGDRHIRITSGEAGTTVTGAVRRTSNDTDGHRWVMAASGVSTLDGTGTVAFDTTNGGADWAFSGASETERFDFGIGYEYNGSSATTDYSAVEIAARHYAPVAEDVLPVVRS